MELHRAIRYTTEISKQVTKSGVRCSSLVMWIQACRDARCNGTLSLPDLRIDPIVLKYRQVQCASILQLSFS
jgi:hypothetical protein